MWTKLNEDSIEYEGCKNCDRQNEPGFTCGFAELPEDVTLRERCPRWIKREDNDKKQNNIQ